MKVTVGVEILSRFSINCKPDLILNAIETGNPDLVRAILNNPQNDLSILKDLLSKGFLSPMHTAAIEGNVEIINLLLERGFPADVNGNTGINLIHLAARYGNYDAVVRLLEFDKDVASSTQSPAQLSKLFQEGHIDIVEFFESPLVDMTNNQVTSRQFC